MEPSKRDEPPAYGVRIPPSEQPAVSGPTSEPAPESATQQAPESAPAAPAPQASQDQPPRYGVRITPTGATPDRGEGQGQGEAPASAIQDSDPYQAPPQPSQPTYGARTQAPGQTQPSGLATPPEGGWAWQQQGYQAPRSRAPRTADGKPKRRWGLLIIGLIVMLVIPTALGIGGIVSVVDGSLSSGSVVGASGTVYLEGGQKMSLYATESGTAVDQCTITDPAGASVPLTDLATQLEETGTDTVTAAQSSQMVPYASFTTTDSGQYTVRCPGGAEGVVVGPAINIGHAMRAGVLVLASLGIGFVGLILTIAGIVRVVRSGRQG